jgi:hypothetical protein
MEILWFRDQVGKMTEVDLKKSKLTVFTKGKPFAAGQKFPLIRGEMKKDLWDLEEGSWDYFVPVKENG